MSTSALSDAIYQNTAGNSQGNPEGLSWDTGVYGTHTETQSPSGFSGVTGWGVVYQQAGASVSPNAASDSVQMEDFTTYLHLTNGTWVEVQNQAQSGISGGHYLADFSSDSHNPLTIQTSSDGSVSMDAPTTGYNDHFFPTQRGSFTAGTVDGVFVEATMKTNDPSANLVAQIGADWWKDSSAQWAGDNVNNTAVGAGNFVKLSTQWQTVYYSSLSAAQLQADPPPGLTTTTTSGGTSSSGTSPSGTTSGSTSGSASSGSTPSGSTSASGGTSSGGTPVTDPTGGTSSGGSTSSGSTSSGGTSASGGTSSGGTPVTDPTGGTSSGSTSGSGSSTTPKAPSLTVADHSLSVNPGHSVSLGLGVTVPNSKDAVTVTIKGLPSYETITDNLDHKTFRGSSINLTAAQVNSGLTLTSHYRGSGDPSSTLTVTAKDSAGASSTPQSITVKDPPATASSGSSTTTSGGSTSSGGSHHHSWSEHHHAVAATGAGTSTSGKSSGQSHTGHSNIAQWFHDHPDFARVATTLSDAGATKSSAAPSVTSTTSSSTPSAGAKAYALLNQMMAGDFGGESHFAHAATASSAASQQQANLLTRPLH